MSKRRRNNRPKNRPSNRPKKVTKKPEVAVANHTRRKIATIGGTAAVIAGLIGYNVLKNDDHPTPPEKQTPKVTAPKTPAVRPKIERMPEYNEWASKIVLPKVEIGDEYSDWPSEKHKDFFKPDDVEIDQERIDEFYKKFLALKQDIFQKVEMTQNPFMRMGLISKFYHELVRHYVSMTNDHSASKLIFGSPESIRLTHRINRYLIPRGHFLWQNNTSRSLANVAFYEVDAFKDLTLEYKGQSKEIPIVVLKNQQEVNSYVNSPATVHSAASYEEVGEYITVQSNHLPENYQMQGNANNFLKSKKALTEYLNACFFHEAMHAMLHGFDGVSTWGNDAINDKGNIGMSEFILPSSGYRNKDNSNLHELGGNGYGLMNSGEGAHEMADTIFQAGVSKDEYGLAFQVLITQIIQSRVIDREFSDKMIKANMGNNHKLFYDLLIQASKKHKPEELHYFGEQMAKLTIHLAQEDK